MPITSVLFVCAGNICRSPLAEALFRRAVDSRPALAALEIGSAGVFALDGDRATPEAVRVARDTLQLDVSRHRARRFTGLDADLILTLDPAVTRAVARARPRGRVTLLGEYAGTGESVDDPYGCPEGVYRHCAEQLDRLIDAVAERMAREPDR